MGEHQMAIMALLMGHAAEPEGDTHIVPLGISNCRLCRSGKHFSCVFGKEINALKVFVGKEKEKRLRRVLKGKAEDADKSCQTNGHCSRYYHDSGRRCCDCGKKPALAGEVDGG